MWFQKRTSTGVVALGASAVLAFAINANGSPTRHLTLDDGGVWVASNANHLWGRFNKPIGQLDAALAPPTGTGDNLDVLQDGPSAAVFDKGSGALYAVDPQLRVIAGDPVAVAGTAQVRLAGGTAAVLTPEGKLRAVHSDAGLPDLAQLGPTGPSLAEGLPKGSSLEVTLGGSVLVASPGTLKVFPVVGGGLGSPVAKKLGTPPGDALQVSAVGEVPVVLDAAAGRVLLPTKGSSTNVGLDPQTALLGAPSPAGSTAYLADSASLLAVPLDGSPARTLSKDGAGAPARPTVLGSCVHMAWAGTAPEYVRVCGSSVGPPQKFSVGAADQAPMFRVNREQIVLNDLASGSVYLADQKLVEANKLWDRAVPNDPGQIRGSAVNNPQGPNHKPEPKDDVYGVRPGLAAVLHVLDNDVDPDGQVLAVTDVTQPAAAGASVAVTRDRQALIATLPAGVASATVRYTVSDGLATAQASVRIEAHEVGRNGPPTPRPGYKPLTLSVAPGGSIRIPVLPDWRDPDGDPLFVATATAAGGVVVPSGDGIAFTAPAAPGPVKITYAVGDGLANPVTADLVVTVLAPTAAPISAVARADVAQGTVGAPLVIAPLDNDLPGADPTDPAAKLIIANPVTAPAGLQVTTDLGRGEITVVAARQGVYTLRYQVGFGTATPASAAIRVDILPAKGKPGAPVAGPDTIVVHGQVAGTVDVVSNDFDPQGNLLVVQDATSVDGDVLVSVIDGSKLRVSSSSGATAVRTVTYRVSNGTDTATGVLSVVVQPPAAQNQAPIAVDDVAVVRAGDVTSVPVLANDTDPDGDPIELAPVTPTMEPAIQGAGLAVSGDRVVFAAPTSITTARQTVVSYTVRDSFGHPTTGHLSISVVPVGSADTDQPPTPTDLEGRMTAGDTLTLHIPVYGIDPDGDSATLVGVDDAPSKGRIVATSADTITYQSYPTASGTDEFTYRVTDSFGKPGKARIRIGIVPPGLPGRPVAADDLLTAAPGRTVHLDVTANDSVPTGSTATVLPLADTNPRVPDGVTLKGKIISVPVPKAGQSTRVVYGLSSGVGDPATASFVVVGQPGATLAPVARDDVAGGVAPVTGKLLTVKPLANDDDPDGSQSGLALVTAFASDVTVAGDGLHIPVLDRVRAVAYQIKDADGLTAIAVVRVAAGGRAVPYLTPGKRLSVPAHGRTTLKLSDYVASPRGRALSIPTTDKSLASPTGALSVDLGVDSVTVTASPDYTGPAAVTFQVTDGATAGDPTGRTALITVPVQVGPPAPALRCPMTPIDVVEGGTPYQADLIALCHVWIDTTVAPIAVKFAATITPSVNKTAVSVTQDTTLKLSADAGADPGTPGTAHLTVPGTPVSADLPFVIVKAPPLTLSPITVPGLIADKAVTVDTAQFAKSPLRGGQITVVSIRQLSGLPVAVQKQGSTFTLTPGHKTNGPVSFQVVVTDVANRGDRAVTATVSTNVQSSPGTPPAPAIVSVGNKQVVLSWAAPSANGSPITGYTVTTSPATGTTNCPSSPCTVRGLANAQPRPYTFRIVAINAIGTSEQSQASPGATPDRVPDQIANLTLTPKDQQLVASWTPPTGDFSPITRYQIDIQPGKVQTINASQVPYPLTGLTNGTAYTVRVRPQNTAVQASGGFGAWTPTQSEVPFGTPATPVAPAAAGASTVAGAKTRGIAVTWTEQQGAGNGRSITGYTVIEYSGSSQTGPFAATGRTKSVPGTGTSSYAPPQFDVTTDGTWYVYSLKATNAGSLTSAESPKSSPAVQGTAPPDQMATPVVTDHAAGASAGYDGAIHVQYVVPAANSASLPQVEYRLNAGATQQWSNSATASTSVERVVTGLTNGTLATVDVRGCNSSNQCGPWSQASTSNPRTDQGTPYGPPAPPTVTATATGGTSSTQNVVFQWLGGGGNGRDIRSYSVCIDSDPCFPSGPANKTKTYYYSTPYTIKVTATDVAEQVSPATTKSGTTPQAPPPNPPTNLAQTRSNDTVTWTWSGGGGYRPVAKYRVCFEGTSSCTDTSSTSIQRNYNYSTAYSATVSAIDDVGQVGPQSNSVGGTTPTPTLSISKGGQQFTTYCTVSYCSSIDVHLRTFVPNTDYVVYFWTDCANGAGGVTAACVGGMGLPERYASQTVHTDGAGNLDQATRSFGFKYANVWVTVDSFQSNHVTW